MDYFLQAFQKAYRFVATTNEAIAAYRAKCWLLLEKNTKYVYPMLVVEGAILIFFGYYKLGVWSFLFLIYIEVFRRPAVKTIMAQYREDQKVLKHHLSTDYLFYNRCWWVVFLLTLLGIFLVARDFFFMDGVEAIMVREGLSPYRHKGTFYALIFFSLFWLGMRLVMVYHIAYYANPRMGKKILLVTADAAKVAAAVAVAAHGFVSGLSLIHI